MTDNEPTPSGFVDVNDPKANMYGCKPCPKCREVYRFPMTDGTVQCDSCGFSEPIAEGSTL